MGWAELTNGDLLKQANAAFDVDWSKAMTGPTSADQPLFHSRAFARATCAPLSGRGWPSMCASVPPGEFR